MIGGIRGVRVGDQMVDADLDDDGVWHSTDSTIEQMLNLRYVPSSHPSQGQFGAVAIIGAARDFDATPVLPRITSIPGVVY